MNEDTIPVNSLVEYDINFTLFGSLDLNLRLSGHA